MYKLCYGLTKQKWFVKLQVNALCLPKDMFESYYKDEKNISRDSQHDAEQQQLQPERQRRTDQGKNADHCGRTGACRDEALHMGVTT